jgi:hypothetical protein
MPSHPEGGKGEPVLHAEISSTGQADRLAIRELIDAYAHCADRRDAEGQKSLFTVDANFTVYMEGQGSEPTQVLDGREALTPVFDDLNRYEARSRLITSGAAGRVTASPITSIRRTECAS